MARVLIRDLDERVIERLKARSLQAELQMTIERPAATDVMESRAIAARMRRKLSDRKHSDSAALVAGDRRR